jgi:molybdopterin-guanine dinucleotide biosynthesis protein A
VIGGIFIGGRGMRMGGVAKGLLEAPDGGTLVARWARLFRALSIEPVLVGTHEAYADLGIPSISDAVQGIGPLGGLISLIERGSVIAVACDMPFVSQSLLERLATFPSERSIVAPKRDGRWEPLFARYDARGLGTARVHAAAGKHSLQALLDAADTDLLPLSAEEAAQLEDWDR